MAITKIYAKRARLDKLIRYVINPEKTDEITTIIYQEDAALMLELLYGVVS